MQCRYVRNLGSKCRGNAVDNLHVEQTEIQDPTDPLLDAILTTSSAETLSLSSKCTSFSTHSFHLNMMVAVRTAKSEAGTNQAQTQKLNECDCEDIRQYGNDVRLPHHDHRDQEEGRTCEDHGNCYSCYSDNQNCHDSNLV